MFPLSNFAEIVANTHEIFLWIGLMAFYVLIYLIWLAKKSYQQKILLSKLEVGNIIYTTGGLIGKVIKIKGSVVLLETGTEHVFIHHKTVKGILAVDSLKFE